MGQTCHAASRSGPRLRALAAPVLIAVLLGACSPEPATPAPATPVGSDAVPPQPSVSPTPTPAVTMSAEPPSEPTPGPTTAPSNEPTTEPPVEPSEIPVDVPPTASCDLVTAEGIVVATIVYPGSWSTLREPDEVACRFFDPDAVELPDDGTAPVAAITVAAMSVAYLDAVANASDPDVWQVETSSRGEVEGVPTTCILGTAIDGDAAGVPDGTTRFQCLADLGSSGTVMIRTEWPPDGSAGGSRTAEARMRIAVVSLMIAASTLRPPA